ncbi:hypothetical protein [Micropruina sp.]|uniref:hypothetical protein n=1 Tax=Micropruina sp. TaxID=2737536 RepID=UPI0039E5F4BC
MPQDGVHDYVDLTLIVNPWQAIVALAVVFALLIWPQLSARSSVRRVEKTLTTNNGGSHIKDQMDRIEAEVHGIAKAQKATDKKLADHLTWSDGFVQDVDRRVEQLESGEPSRRRRFLFRRRR